jgi:hypothetical protein
MASRLRTGDPGPSRCAILDLSGPEAREGPTVLTSIQNNSGLPQGLAGRSATRLSVQ